MYICTKIFTIATNTLNISQFQNHFKNAKFFNTSDVLAFYQKKEPQMKTSTLNWRVYLLVKLGVLSRIGRGVFTLGAGKIFLPQISAKEKALYRKLKSNFPYLQICIWNTSVLNEFMLHQLGRFYILVEVEKDSTESVFNFLKEQNKNVFLNPSSEILNRYATNEKQTIVVKQLISEAPTQNSDTIETATIEKILVDIFTDDVIFMAQQGREMSNIFKEVFAKYTINENKLLRYAARKNKKEDIDNYLNKVSNYRQ